MNIVTKNGNKSINGYYFKLSNQLDTSNIKFNIRIITSKIICSMSKEIVLLYRAEIHKGEAH